MNFNALFSFLVSMFCGLMLLGQQSVYHPLTFNGVGDYQLQNQAYYSALGRTFAASFDSSQLNFFNPASYSKMTPGLTLYSLGINQRISTFEQNGERFTKGVGNLDHLAIGFRVGKHFGMAFGLKPFAAKGLELTERIFTGLDSIKNTYKGRGYVNDVFLGLSYAPIVTNRTHLSFGAQVSYLFGSVTNQRISQLIEGTTTSGGIMQDFLQIKAPKIDFGFAFSQKITDRYRVQMGATFTPKQNLGGELSNDYYTSSNLNNVSLYDTLYSSKYEGFIIQNTSFSVGMSHIFYLNDRIKKNKTLHPNLMVSMQYSQAGTIDYQFTGDTTSLNPTNSTVKFSRQIGVGIQYSPETKIFENITALKFFDKLIYRLGGFMGEQPYRDLTNNPYMHRGLTAGIGIPIMAQQSLSSINLALTAGQRGTFVANSLLENYWSFQLGATFSPAAFERWFRKRKMD